MKCLLTITAGLFLGFNSAAMASTTEMDVIYSPFSEGVATLSVPTRADCEVSGRSIDIVKCSTPGATLDLGGLRDIVIEKVAVISGRSGELTYSDETYSGSMMVNGTPVPVKLTLPTRNGTKFPGTLYFTNDQAFTVVRK